MISEQLSRNYDQTDKSNSLSVEALNEKYMYIVPLNLNIPHGSVYY